MHDTTANPHETTESMTHAYDVRTGSRFRRATGRTIAGVRRGYDVSRRGIEVARRRAVAARLAFANARAVAA
ncbi:hypothetical protein [Halarchaeum salinum]|uniref:Uncharacterized protein n=1 Tax=Halarchaeum salinum TaxID=489912 RepID=A0AAV3S7K8_9EURY